MQNDKIRQTPAGIHPAMGPRALSGRSCPQFAAEGEATKIPRDVPPRRLCDGSLPNTENEGCGTAVGGWGLRSYPLAMVYSPLQDFDQLYTPEVALERGTLFSELDLPFEGDKRKKGGCCL